MPLSTYNEFLYVDLGRKLVGKEVVAVVVHYMGEIPKFRPGAIEAEIFVPERRLWALSPLDVVETPEEILASG